MTNYKQFKKEWLQRKVAKEKREVEALAKEKMGETEEGVEAPKKRIKGLEQVRAELQA